ncbi:MAG: YigZ family protein, partial [Lachnospiraceae bacterium]|nr:YigZ family protein [Lachnospiraceae bacterium]
MKAPYKVLLEGKSAETELKKSRFIAHLQPVETEEEAQEFIASIRKQYYDARHNCYAYVLGKDADKVKYSDDGEPAQTGGLPIFNVLKETGVRNACIVVTRYFGGTLLGAGPL